MPSISELQKRAITFEQQGEDAKALAIYEHVLRFLDGNPALVKVLPWYVKVGDLHLKLSHPVEAVSAYNSAAEHYATQGSAQRVIALCDKMRQVHPERGEVYVQYARQLVDHGHPGSARDVLWKYAHGAGLKKMLEALDQLAGQQNAELRPKLEQLIASLERGEPLEADQAAERISIQWNAVTDTAAGDLTGVPHSPELATAEQSFAPPHDHAETTPDDALKRESAPQKTPSAADIIEASVASEALAGAAPSPVPQRRRKPKKPVPTPSVKRTGPSRRLSILGGFLVGLLTGVGLGVADMIPAGVDLVEAMPFLQSITALVPSTAPPTAEPIPSPMVAGDATAGGQTVADTSPAAVDMDREAAVFDSTPSAAGAAPAAPADSIPYAEPVAAPRGNPIVVEGLEILRVTEIEFRGQAGFRVEQLLDWAADPITIESYPVQDEPTDASAIGQVIVNVTPPDTVVGIVRLERHQVYASGVMAEDSLRSLMSRLVEREPSN